MSSVHHEPAVALLADGKLVAVVEGLAFTLANILATSSADSGLLYK
jgi:hypothetical protein